MASAVFFLIGTVLHVAYTPVILHLHYLTFVSDVFWDPVELIILLLLLMQFCPHIGKYFF